jgi:hypothetical protein
MLISGGQELKTGGQFFLGEDKNCPWTIVRCPLKLQDPYFIIKFQNIT